MAIYQSVCVLLFYFVARGEIKRCSMRRSIVLGVAAVLFSNLASAQPVSLAPPEPVPQTAQMVVAAAQPPQAQPNLGGGFIEFLFGDSSQQTSRASRQWYGAPPQEGEYRGLQEGRPIYAYGDRVDPMLEQRQYDGRMDPRFLRQEVAYIGKESPGTVVIDTPNHFLYLVGSNGRAIRYGIGVGRPGFTWRGVHAVSGKKEWPDWVPPDEMLKRQPYLPHFVAGGPNNPLGARALYLGSTLYRIHGSNEPWTIGQNVSSGCIRMRNADVIDLYERIKVGTKVVVL
jgi:lipoprotein-anchoring transpeptidase ErfK/SrfK